MRFRIGKPFNEDLDDYRYLEDLESDSEFVDLDKLNEVELVDEFGDPVVEDDVDGFDDEPDSVFGFYDY